MDLCTLLIKFLPSFRSSYAMYIRLLQDFHLIDKLAHFDRERIPERVVHAKGAGAHGYFEVTSSEITKYCKAKLFEKVGKKTPIFLRFSTVGGEKGSADTERDPRGFAVKFYTEEGIITFTIDFST